MFKNLLEIRNLRSSSSASLDAIFIHAKFAGRKSLLCFTRFAPSGTDNIQCSGWHHFGETGNGNHKLLLLYMYLSYLINSQIGDSFLKMAVTNYFYHMHNEQHEGKLSFARSKEVLINDLINNRFMSFINL
jgi:hypothetical protein